MNYCGSDCENCNFKAPCACPGCGTPFYGVCEVAACAEEKGLENCGTCADFPCEKLMACAHDPITGDGGARIEFCRKEADK